MKLIDTINLHRVSHNELTFGEYVTVIDEDGDITCAQYSALENGIPLFSFNGNNTSVCNGIKYRTNVPPMWMDRRDPSGIMTEKIKNAHTDIYLNVYEAKFYELKVGDTIDFGEFYQKIYNIKKLVSGEGAIYIEINEDGADHELDEEVTVVKINS